MKGEYSRTSISGEVGNGGDKNVRNYHPIQINLFKWGEGGESGERAEF